MSIYYSFYTQLQQLNINKFTLKVTHKTKNLLTLLLIRVVMPLLKILYLFNKSLQKQKRMLPKKYTTICFTVSGCAYIWKNLYIGLESKLIDVGKFKKAFSGLFSSSRFPFYLNETIQKTRRVPRLKELTEKAIQIMERDNPNGYFLMVEGLTSHFKIGR